MSSNDSVVMAGAERAELQALRAELTALRTRIVADASVEAARWLVDADDRRAASVLNLLYYRQFRRIDLRGLQRRLSNQGLSSLGRSEAHLLHDLDRVLALLAGVLEGKWFAARATQGPDILAGEAILAENTQRLFGAHRDGTGVYIMVTLPTEAADDQELVAAMIRSGMDCARINGAHDDPAVWRRMIEQVRRASEDLQRPCRIYMDLPGPKLRTSAVPAAPVFAIHPPRDFRGRVVAPADVILVPARNPPVASKDELPLSTDLFNTLKPAGRLRFRDTRGRMREIEIVERDAAGRWHGCIWHTAFIEPGMSCSWRGPDAMPADRQASCFGSFPERPGFFVVRPDDRLLLTRSHEPGEAVQRDVDGKLLQFARIGITCPEIIDDLQVGHRVFIDDGKVGAVVEALTPAGAVLRITQARAEGEKVRGAKGLNFPDSTISLPSLTVEDLQMLDLAAREADIVGYSFVRTADDISRLMAELDQRGAGDIPVVAKIETAQAVRNLPEILLTALPRRPLGVMVARGDLAVEIGPERLAEIQEEILWLCEAAHVPVIWATQVLESLARKGTPTRAEITDAAMGVRAECVMLNKGPYICRAIETLRDIMQRMNAHQHKKTARLRALHW
ncbi:MAG: pyruvate kinase [Pseudomonadota bacterium]